MKRYYARVNQIRCECAHVPTNGSRKKCGGEQVYLPIDTMVDYWDSLSLCERKHIICHAVPYLSCIPKDALHSIRVECRLVQIVSGDVDISGSDLMMALQEASENTVVWKLARPMKTFETFNQTDFVAGMAHTIGTKLEEEQAADQAAALSLVSSAECFLDCFLDSYLGNETFLDAHFLELFWTS